MLCLALIILQQQEPIVPLDRPGRDGRGREPWVFRCIFEDRTRMVILAVAKDWWMAFNPETCAMHKVWQGKMDFRGKVWDFSQDNSRAEGRTWFASPSEMWRLPDAQTLPPKWTGSGVTFEKDGWSFVSGGWIQSPSYDASRWQRVFLAFDETGRPNRFRINIDDLKSGPTQCFDSATHVSSETDWQWNFKRIESPTEQMRVRISSDTTKRLKNVRMYGDKPSWFGMDGKPLTVNWRGYELIGETKGVVLKYDLVLRGGQPVQVTHKPDRTAAGWVETVELKGIPVGQEIYLRRDGMSQGVRATSQPPFDKGEWYVGKDGTYRFEFGVPL